MCDRRQRWSAGGERDGHQMNKLRKAALSRLFKVNPLFFSLSEFSADYFKAEHPMSDLLNQSDGEGNHSNELGDRSDAENLGDRSDAENHGILLISDPIPGQHRSSQLGDGANTIPSGTSIEAVPSNILNAPSIKVRKRKSGSSDGAKQKKKGKKQKFDDECKRIKNELTSSEAENASVKDHCDRVLEDLTRLRAIVDYMKEKSNELTDKVTELCMKLIYNGENESDYVNLQANMARLLNYEEQSTSGEHGFSLDSFGHYKLIREHVSLSMREEVVDVLCFMLVEFSLSTLSNLCV
ncbi:hypothetical protein SADUNF_Sadunf03G0117500 [Salix dunnii]|uniref:Uncharacterized protein n=1 Tax=Salix dunnii TaxID=1413687 RepID=A0A835N4D4_9ROSI|nr:hypothetical protein SADUNF_Sadunf03G0117500 [Salix dunnii]